MEVNIFYKVHRERMEIDMIGGQKWSVILEMLQIACHNPEIGQKTGEVKMTRCLEKCGKQWRPKQKKQRWQKQKEEKKKEEETKKREDNGSKESDRGIGDLG